MKEEKLHTDLFHLVMDLDEPNIICEQVISLREAAYARALIALLSQTEGNELEGMTTADVFHDPLNYLDEMGYYTDNINKSFFPKIII